MRTLYLVSKRLPRVCMGGSTVPHNQGGTLASAPRVHGWFHFIDEGLFTEIVCPACAWVVP